nr:uncharacterized protein LOC129048074 [Pongo abelii]
MALKQKSSDYDNSDMPKRSCKGLPLSKKRGGAWLLLFLCGTWDSNRQAKRPSRDSGLVRVSVSPFSFFPPNKTGSYSSFKLSASLNFCGRGTKNPVFNGTKEKPCNNFGAHHGDLRSDLRATAPLHPPILAMAGTFGPRVPHSWLAGVFHHISGDFPIPSQRVLLHQTRWDLNMLPRLLLTLRSSWPQVILLPCPPKVLELWA